MDFDWAVLTDRQRVIFLLHAYKSMPFAKIAEKMGLTVYAARKSYQQALARMEQAEQARLAGREQTVYLPLTRGDVEDILAGLALLQESLQKKARGPRDAAAGREHLPFRAQRISPLQERAQGALK